MAVSTAAAAPPAPRTRIGASAAESGVLEHRSHGGGVGRVTFDLPVASPQRVDRARSSGKICQSVCRSRGHRLQGHGHIDAVEGPGFSSSMASRSPPDRHVGPRRTRRAPNWPRPLGGSQVSVNGRPGRRAVRVGFPRSSTAHRPGSRSGKDPVGPGLGHVVVVLLERGGEGVMPFQIGQDVVEELGGVRSAGCLE